MKRVVSVQDLCGMGKCSLTVALPVLSAMGLACSVLPTAILSTHTAFAEPVCLELTGQLLPMAEHWARVGGQFDGIGIGYLSSPAQAETVMQVLDLLQIPLTVVDPVMGDHGKLYSRITPEHVQAMGQLCRRADVLLPNLTEAAFLTGLPYREQPEEGYLRELLDGLHRLGVVSAVITGVHWAPDRTGFIGQHPDTGIFSYEAERIPRQLHGTGDMFAAVVLGALTQGKILPQAAEQAAGFVERVVRQTAHASPFGAEFEPVLPWLQQL